MPQTKVYGGSIDEKVKDQWHQTVANDSFSTLWPWIYWVVNRYVRGELVPIELLDLETIKALKEKKAALK